MEPHYIPKYLNAQPQFLWWDADEVMILLAGLIIGTTFDQRIIFIGIALIIQKIYAKSKDHKQVGFGSHWLYAMGLKKFSKVPPYYVKLYLK
jgi:type IV conjugative transfer system protein TraL